MKAEEIKIGIISDDIINELCLNFFLKHVKKD